jgi:hypothetical protein
MLRMFARGSAFAPGGAQMLEENVRGMSLTLGDILESLVGSHDCGW